MNNYIIGFGIIVIFVLYLVIAQASMWAVPAFMLGFAFSMALDGLLPNPYRRE